MDIFILDTVTACCCRFFFACVLYGCSLENYIYIYISYNINIFDRSALVSSPFLLQPLFLLFLLCCCGLLAPSKLGSWVFVKCGVGLVGTSAAK